jgi:hypothetical protein
MPNNTDGGYMKTSELIAYAQAALEAWGDLECYMDVEGEETFDTVELACELYDDGDKRLVITNYELPLSHLRLVT